MLPGCEWKMLLKFIFQYDSDPKLVKQWFVNVLKWPTQSLDLNPIEKLCKIVDKKIRENFITNFFEQKVC